MEMIQIDEVRAWHTCDAEGIQVWDLFIESGKRSLSRPKEGQLVLFRTQYESATVWIVANVWLRNVRGRGIMRRLITALRPRYPEMVSDLSGQTSPAACRMFEALGAEKMPYGASAMGFIYRLRPLLLPLPLAVPGPQEGVGNVAPMAPVGLVNPVGNPAGVGPVG